MMLWKRRRIMVLVVALALAAVIVTVALRRPKRSLLECATRVSSVKSWSLEDEYVWLSDHEVLHIAGPAGHLRLMGLDLQTGHDTESQPLTRLIQRTTRLPNALTLSPDRTLILWSDLMSGRVTGATVDGRLLFSAHSSAARFSLRECCWLADDRHWSEPVLSGLAIHDSAEHGEIRTVKLAAPLYWPFACYATNDNRLVIDTTLRLPGQPVRPGPGSLQVIEIDPVAGNPVLRVIPIRESRNTAPFVAAISPSGDRIAWCEVAPRIPGPAAELWRRLWRNSYWNNVPRRVSLKVAGIRGGGTHEVASMDFQHASMPFFQIQWLPDGKQLSFIYDGSLWTVPVQ